MLGVESDSVKDLRAGIDRRLWVQCSAANLAGAALAAASGALTGANIAHQRGFGWVDLITLCVYLALAVPLGGTWMSRRSKRADTWLYEDRPPTAAEQREVLAAPWKATVVTMLGWLGAAAIWSGLTAASHGGGYVARVALSIALGGLATSGLTYLLVEWTLRPVTALALATHVPNRPVIAGVRTKLVLSWAVGADVFLIMIGLTFLGRPAHEPPSPAAIWFIVGAGLVAGTVVLHVATRSLANPLVELRQAVGRVQQGDVALDVPVSDGGELGLLQAGFNQMVAGLRERRVLEDLFGRHVGEDVARQAVREGVALRGARCEVGVVFVDLVGSTGLVQSHSPEAVVEILNRFFSAVVRTVAAEGGWVNKFEGDGALCVFGVPLAREDHAARALRAARTIRRELLALAAVHPQLDAAIGVSAGAVVAGNVGAEQRYEYTVVGPPVNEAARLTEEAKRRLGRVLASEEAVARAGHEANQWLVADELSLRGFTHPSLAYEPGGDVHVGESVA